MIYGGASNYSELKKFQNWVIRRYYQFTDWEQFKKEKESSFYARKISTEQPTFPF